MLMTTTTKISKIFFFQNFKNCQNYNNNNKKFKKIINDKKKLRQQQQNFNNIDLLNLKKKSKL